MGTLESLLLACPIESISRYRRVKLPEERKNNVLTKEGGVRVCIYVCVRGLG